MHDIKMQKKSFDQLPLSTTGPQDCALSGNALLQNPYLNKGSAFTTEERNVFKLYGLLPNRISTLEEQVKRAYEQYRSISTALEKNTFMTSMKDQNEVLFYRLIQTHLIEMFSIIYTPTEGEAIANYSRIFRRPEGLFLSIADPDGIETAVNNWRNSENVDIIVCSDGEQILGIGDQGTGGILIAVAKLVLYTLCAGIHPHRTLPIVLDVGTDNHELLSDELYLGLRRPRARQEEYENFIKRFIQICKARFPMSYLHFEDFGLQNARRILDIYSPQIACFNDDVQGTGCVALAAIFSAIHVAGYKLADLRVIIFGAGSAGTGIADQIRDAISVESGKSKEAAAKHIWCVDKPGLLLIDQKDDLTPAQKGYAKPNIEWQHDNISLKGVVEKVKPHVLIGCSTKPSSFTKEIVQEMAKHVERPIIFPLSNPTKLHEAVPKDLFEWTDGKVLTATGSPFPPVLSNGRMREISECNNSVIFPGIGLGAVLSKAKFLSAQILVVATKALAARAPTMKDPGARLLPAVTDVREISVHVAAAVIKQAVQEDLAQRDGIPNNDEDLDLWIREQMWDAKYRPLRRINKAEAGSAALGELGSKGVIL